MNVLTLILALNFAPVTPGADTLTLETDINLPLVAATLKDQATTGPDRLDSQVNDHYGNPDNFIQYIIRIPPVHA